MEDLVMEALFKSVYKGKRVFLTGHTGFKGSWLALWLKELGAEVLGYSNGIPSSPCHYDLLELDITSIVADIRDQSKLNQAVLDFQPEIIFHLAAQPLVRYSYARPAETFETNVIGTVNVFEAARNCSSVKAIVNITSDKAYENLEADIAYKESDRMGGYDPYSASKGCAELVVNSYRNSYFNIAQYGATHHVLLASARAGNVIGGGDWAADRLIPDVVKAIIDKRVVCIRNPNATRPWQHVLEPLSGYLLLGQKLLEQKKEIADGWNFGPLNNDTLQVKQVLEQIKGVWDSLQYRVEKAADNLHEAHLLRLDCNKAKNELNWYPVWSMDTAIERTASWYKKFYNESVVVSRQDLEEYINNARAKNILWTC